MRGAQVGIGLREGIMRTRMTGTACPVRLALDDRRWSRSGCTHVRGYAHLDGHHLSARSLAAIIDACTSDETWLATIRRLNGCFAVVTEQGDGVLAAVDRIRSIPLFWGGGTGSTVVSDDAHRVPVRAEAPALDPDCEIEFSLTGYVTGAQTLRPGVRQLEAGTWMRWSNRGHPAPQALRYYAFTHGDFDTAAVPQLIDRLAGVHEAVFLRLLDSAQGRPIVVPLSGGYDSRLIGVSLRDLGARDVLCYSYGVPGNWESKISKELADYLGFRWEFVPYDARRWRAWAETKEFREYFHLAGNLTSVPHVQDWPAIFELTRAGTLARDSLIVPGHTGDFLVGGHIPKWYASRSMVTRRAILDSLQKTHYSLWDWPAVSRLRETFDRRIESVVGPIADGSPEYAAGVFERWELQERQAKFICNSVRVYEQFGYEWRLPLYDAELMDFWSRVPVDLRLGRSLYFAFTRDRQTLPITPANSDYGPAMRAAVLAIDFAGLRPLAKRVHRLVRRLRWRKAYESSPLAWPALVDVEEFSRTFTGQELMHSYMARRYRHHAATIEEGFDCASP